MSTWPVWHVPFKGRCRSGATTQNFLWQHGNVYVMDNHRAALWCWLREIGVNEDVALIHIDEHYDTLYSRIDEWLALLPDLRTLSIDEYLAFDYLVEGFRIPVIRWDNYLSIFLERYSHQVVGALFATHGEGDEPRSVELLQCEARNLPSNLAYHMDRHAQRLIVNVDLDYFFCDDENDERKLMFSEEYITSIFYTLRTQLEAGRITCLTLCLTPDESYTGGWAQAEALCARACEILGVPFALGPDPA